MKIKLALIGLLSLGLYIGTAHSNSTPNTVTWLEETAAVIEESGDLFELLGIELQSLGLHVSTADLMPGTVASAEEAAAVMEERSEFMKTMGSSMKAFGGYVKRGDGEPLELALMAAEIAKNASKIPSLFPENTGAHGIVEDSESEAKPEIWQNWADFVAAAEALVEPAVGLAMAFEAEESREDIGRRLGALGKQGCKACHDQFREKHDH